MEGILIFIEQCLKEFEYPNIYGTDLAEILGGPNRIFLLSWLYNLIMGEQCSGEQTIEVLSEFLNCFGFCPSSQTQRFLAMNLDYPIQLQIFFRIFKMLKTVRKENKGFVNSDEMSMRKIHDFMQTDVNLFKSFGNLKFCQHVSEKVDDEPSTLIKSASEKSEHINTLSVLEGKLDHAAHIMSNISERISTGDVDINLNECWIEDVKEFNECISNAEEVIKNVQALSSLKEGLLFDQVVIPDEKENEYTGMAKEIVRLINDI